MLGTCGGYGGGTQEEGGEFFSSCRHSWERRRTQSGVDHMGGESATGMGVGPWRLDVF